jgi:hypothetical protein
MGNMTAFRMVLPGFALLALGLSGCNAWQDRAEFAPPESRWPVTEPSPIDKEGPPPAIRSTHCYRTLASVDCYPEKQPQRYSGYTGTYPED